MRIRKKNGYLVQGIFSLLFAIMVIAVVIGMIQASARAAVTELNPGINMGEDSEKDVQAEADSLKAKEMITSFAVEHNLDISVWPEEIIDLLAKNPDAEEFVLNYPLKKEECFEIDLSEYSGCDKVPLFFQWDERWGYTMYGANVMGLTGCGPTCLSMVCVYLLDDTNITPRYVADFSEKSGYCVPGSGSSWTLISKGGEAMGLKVTEIPLDENRIIRNLELGYPVICVMGPGDFTTTGHFIVMTGIEDGKIKINDPNSKVRSEKLWEYDDIQGQIRNLWVCQKKE